MTCREAGCICARFEPVEDGSTICRCAHSCVRHRVVGKHASANERKKMPQHRRQQASEPPVDASNSANRKMPGVRPSKSGTSRLSRRSSLTDWIEKFSQHSTAVDDDDGDDDGFYTADELDSPRNSGRSCSRGNSAMELDTDPIRRSLLTAQSRVLPATAGVPDKVLEADEPIKSPDMHSRQASEEFRFRYQPDAMSKEESTSYHASVGNVNTAIDSRKVPPKSISAKVSDSSGTSNGEAKMLDFARRLPHAFDKVKDQLETGMAEVYRLKQFLSKLCQMQSDFADEMSGLIRRERDKITSWRRPDHMITCSTSVLDMFERAEEMARIHKWFSSEARLSVVEPLETFEDIGTNILNQVIEKEKQITGPMDTRRTAMDKRRAECMRLLTMHGQDLGLHVTSADTVGRKQRFFQKLKAGAVGKGENARDKHASAVVMACESYAEEVEVSNHILKQYTSSSIPEVLTEMQNLEEMRLNSIRNHLEKFGSLMLPMSNMFAHLSEGLINSANQIRISDDISNFAQSTANQFAEGSKRLTPFIYDLGVPLEKIRAIASAPKGAGTLFKTTLKKIMDNQKQEYPHLKIPRIFPLLQSTVEELGGFDVEGIFRISAEASELFETSAQVEAGKFPLQCSSPHVPAALLKKWLRDLEEPLIVDSLYDKCVEIGIKDDSATAEEINSVINQLPDVNRLLVLGIIRLMRKVADNQAKNRMGIKSLAIVFVPSMLRCIAENPVTMLKNSQFECRFVERAAELLDTSDYPEDEDHSPSRRRPSQRPPNLDIDAGASRSSSLRDSVASPAAPPTPHSTLPRRQSLNPPSTSGPNKPSSMTLPPQKSSLTHDSVASPATPPTPHSTLPRRQSLNPPSTSGPNKPSSLSLPPERSSLTHVIPDSSVNDGASGRPAVPPLPDLPPGWRSATSASGRQYFYNLETRVTQWDRPAN